VVQVERASSGGRDGEWSVSGRVSTESRIRKRMGEWENSPLRGPMRATDELPMSDYRDQSELSQLLHV